MGKLHKVNIFCISGQNEVEDLLHYLCHCPRYRQLRERFIYDLTTQLSDFAETQRICSLPVGTAFSVEEPARTPGPNKIELQVHQLMCRDFTSASQLQDPAV